MILNPFRHRRLRQHERNERAKTLAYRLIWELQQRGIRIYSEDPRVKPEEVLHAALFRLGIEVPKNLPYV